MFEDNCMIGVGYNRRVQRVLLNNDGTLPKHPQKDEYIVNPDNDKSNLHEEAGYMIGYVKDGAETHLQKLVVCQP